MLALFESREGTALVMLAKLLLRVCLLSLNQGKDNIGNVDKTASMSMLTLFGSREGTALVMLAKLLLRVCLLSLNQGKVQHW